MLSSSVPAQAKSAMPTPVPVAAKGKKKWLWLPLKILGILLGAAIMFIILASIVLPRMAGWVVMSNDTTEMEPTLLRGSELIISPIREDQAKELEEDNVVVYQPNPEVVEYQVRRVVGRGSAAGGNIEIKLRPDSTPDAEPTGVKPDAIRGIIKYSLPYTGTIAAYFTEGTRSLFLILVSGILLAIGGWYVGAAIANSRDPQTQARRMRLKAAAAAGRLESDRRRAQRAQKRHV